MKRFATILALVLGLSAALAGATLAAEAIVGTQRADTLEGTRAGEEIRGLGGADTVRGRPGDDLLRGNEGGDRLNGGPGRDRFFGGAGDDSVDARDGERDGTIDCGTGRDTVRTDGGEPTFDCEREVAEAFPVPQPGEVAP